MTELTNRTDPCLIERRKWEKIEILHLWPWPVSLGAPEVLEQKAHCCAPYCDVNRCQIMIIISAVDAFGRARCSDLLKNTQRDQCWPLAICIASFSYSSDSELQGVQTVYAVCTAQCVAQCTPKPSRVRPTRISLISSAVFINISLHTSFTHTSFNAVRTAIAARISKFKRMNFPTYTSSPTGLPKKHHRLCERPAPAELTSTERYETRRISLDQKSNSSELSKMRSRSAIIQPINHVCLSGYV